MPKPRVILVDTSYQYLVTLQRKFAEEYYDKIDLEIITEREYFSSFLSTPQSAEILIVSEELYDESIQRHNISYIFVMTENSDSETESAGSTQTLFKYSSIKEIFNVITGKSSDKLNVSAEKKKTQIVVVYSPCGGVGKTTVSLGISACLAKNYKRVLYINADQLQTFQRFMDDSSALTSASAYEKLSEPDKDIYNDISPIFRKQCGFSYLPPFRAALMSLGINYKIFAYIADATKRTKNYDFIIIDANSGFDNNLATLLNLADKVIVVTDSSASAVYGTNLFVSNVNGINGEKYMFINNNCLQEDSNIGSGKGTKYTVNEYVGHIEDYDNKTCEDFGREKGIQKVAFLLV